METNQQEIGNPLPKHHGMMTGLFADRASTENAYNTLFDKGYSKDDINLVMSEDTRNKHFADHTADAEIETTVIDGAVKGSMIGSTIGAVTGIIAAIATSFVIPGLGILIAGPIAAGLAGAGTGAIAGGLIGSLMGAEISEEKAKIYEGEIKKGQILLGVRPRNEEDAEYFEKSWRANQGEGSYQ